MVTAYLTVRNPRPTTVQFVLEPWGELYDLPPHAAFLVAAEGPDGAPACLVLDAGPDYLTVWGWEGATVRLYHGDRELPAPGTRRPAVPAGLAVIDRIMPKGTCVEGAVGGA